MLESFGFLMNGTLKLSFRHLHLQSWFVIWIICLAVPLVCSYCRGLRVIVVQNPEHVCGIWIVSINICLMLSKIVNMISVYSIKSVFYLESIYLKLFVYHQWTIPKLLSAEVHCMCLNDLSSLKFHINYT